MAPAYVEQIIGILILFCFMAPFYYNYIDKGNKHFVIRRVVAQFGDLFIQIFDDDRAIPSRRNRPRLLEQIGGASHVAAAAIDPFSNPPAVASAFIHLGDARAFASTEPCSCC